MILFDRVSSVDTLAIAWAKVLANGGGPGGDGQSLHAFGRCAEERLFRLHRDLREGTYIPGPVRRVSLPKRDGETRPLAIPCVVDRVAQTAAAQVLGPILDAEMEDASFAYRPGRSVASAVDRIRHLHQAGYEWVVDGDIERYFESVPQKALCCRLAKVVSDGLVLDLVELWLKSFSANGVGLPQGSPISPILSNLYLDEVDEKIEKHGVRLVRYADDFVLLCRSEHKAQNALTQMRALLLEYGLALNPDKTHIVPFCKGFRFLGNLFVRSLILPSKYSDTIAKSQPLRSERRANKPTETAREQRGAPSVSEEVSTGLLRNLSPGLRVLYVLGEGRALGTRSRSFRILEDHEEVAAIPHRFVDRIEVGPGVSIETEALRLATSTATELALIDRYGETVGLCRAPSDENSALHMAQARQVLVSEHRLATARKFVVGRVRGQRALLNRLNRRRKQQSVELAGKRLTASLRRLSCAGSIEELMGYEGAAAAVYWPAYASCLEHGWCLEVRRRRPPTDPVNAVLSYVSAVLYRELSALISRRGLHPGFGCLHSARDGHPALASDLIEQFRAPIVESLTMYLFNNRVLKVDHFAQLGDGTCRIEPDGRTRLIHNYHAWLDRPIKSRRSNKRMRWRRLMDEQVIAFIAHVKGREEYAPYEMSY